MTSQSPNSSPEEVLEDVLDEVLEDVEGDSVTEVEVPNVLDVSLKGLLEAILMVVDEPASEIMLAQISERPLHEVVAVLKDLAAEYE
ncbi:MAG: SMC-Scp complex subunit ScpB, partial [Actinobacteria bacterium]|nr:SMC-Scp complex subunit ScpB [Actinomycetota bacterium]